MVKRVDRDGFEVAAWSLHDDHILAIRSQTCDVMQGDRCQVRIRLAVLNGRAFAHINHAIDELPVAMRRMQQHRPNHLIELCGIHCRVC